MDIAENNKLIAEFMGMKPTDRWYSGEQIKRAGIPFSAGVMGNVTNELKFSTSWDWLMPVVCSILDTCSDVLLQDKEQYEKFETALWSIDIEELYAAVVGFINWLYKELQ